jgi:hypothetical protein
VRGRRGALVPGGCFAHRGRGLHGPGRDAGDAPDVTRIALRPVAGGLSVNITLAAPTALGSYGWILFGVDTDRNPYTGGGRGDAILLSTNGERTIYAKWNGLGFTAAVGHHNVHAVLTSSDLTFTLSWADLGTGSFDFSVATLRQDADIAPGRRRRLLSTTARRAPSHGPGRPTSSSTTSR